MSENIIDGLRSEISRVNEIIVVYEHPDLNGAGGIAAYVMKGSISRAEKALSEFDTIQMILSYKALQEYTL